MDSWSYLLCLQPEGSALALEHEKRGPVSGGPLWLISAPLHHLTLWFHFTFWVWQHPWCCTLSFLLHQVFNKSQCCCTLVAGCTPCIYILDYMYCTKGISSRRTKGCVCNFCSLNEEHGLHCLAAQLYKDRNQKIIDVSDNWSIYLECLLP